jgi:hypothetical protein
MKHIPIFLLFALCSACANSGARNPEVVAAEEHERQKPLLTPPGGAYFRGIAVKIVNYSGDYEYSMGGAFLPLAADTIAIIVPTHLTVRNRFKNELTTTDFYDIADTFPALQASLPPGLLDHATVVTLSTPLKNVRIETADGEAYVPYDAETGIVISQTTTLSVRQCSGAECSTPVTLLYQIAPPSSQPPQQPAVKILTEQQIQDFIAAASNRYNQTVGSGLAALLDEAKALVIHDPALIANTTLRQRFLSQDNTTTAAEACTIVARYLYVTARRLAFGDRSLIALPDFPHYYIRHIVNGDITVDSGGRNFVWLMNGAALVTPYLPAETLSAFEFARGAAYPNDYGLIDKLGASSQPMALLRDGPSATAQTHTFFAIQNGGGYSMIDTYFAAFDGIELKATAGKSWPFAFRFGPMGSRYLHFVYGY